MGWSAAGSETQLEVSGSTLEDLRWVVRVTGSAKWVDPSEPAQLANLRRTHPTRRLRFAAVPVNRLFLDIPRVRGFYETSVTEADT